MKSQIGTQVGSLRTRVQVEYVWVDGTSPTALLRSKTKIVDLDRSPESEVNIEDFPEWGFDGSSTNQAGGSDSDCVLKPVSFVEHPLMPREPFHYESGGISLDFDLPTGYIVMCEVFCGDGVTPHASNTRAELRRVMDAGARDAEPWFGLEQEYTLFKFMGVASGQRPLGFVSGHESAQGPYYCGVGSERVVGRKLIEEHAAACLTAGIILQGTNAEVMPGQWEFQVGHSDPLTTSDHLWLARWLLLRISEDHNIIVSFEPKPAEGDWNGAGCHTNFSTEAMRVASDVKVHRPGTHEPRLQGLDAIKDACLKLGEKHEAHIAAYGFGIEDRLTGKHETCSYKEFRWGIADRGASIRIPRHVREKGYGYLEDRRPCANMDPYVVTSMILKTVLGIT